MQPQAKSVIPHLRFSLSPHTSTTNRRLTVKVAGSFRIRPEAAVLDHTAAAATATAAPRFPVGSDHKLRRHGCTSDSNFPHPQEAAHRPQISYGGMER
ncbi:hypothetical protein ACP70R_006913 [Stipagrostis hirtigluma subsp. patula]